MIIFGRNRFEQLYFGFTAGFVRFRGAAAAPKAKSELMGLFSRNSSGKACGMSCGAPDKLFEVGRPPADHKWIYSGVRVGPGPDDNPEVEKCFDGARKGRNCLFAICFYI